MSDLLGDALRSARKQKHMTQGDVAAHLGVSRAAVGQWEAGDNRPSTANLLKLCGYLEIDMVSALEGTVQNVMFTSEQAAAMEHDVRGKRRPSPHGLVFDADEQIHIVRSSAGGSADFVLHEEWVGWVPRPLGIAKALGARALYMVGTTMVPRYDEGDILLLSVARPPSLNDYVMVRMNGSEIAGQSDCYVRQLVSRSAGRITLRQLNPLKTITVDLKNIKSIERVYPWNEIIGA